MDTHQACHVQAQQWHEIADLIESGPILEAKK